VSKKKIEYDLAVIAKDLAEMNANIQQLYLFGSRRFNTTSERSDVDILVKHTGYIRPGKVRAFVQQYCQALDLFLVETNRAVSVVNESFVEADNFDNLLQRLNATLFWERETGVVADADIHWKFWVRKDIDYKMTALPNIIIDEKSALLPPAIFENTRQYIERVVDQINKSYEEGLFDCCAVMCRRLLETLIIEVYEHLGSTETIKGSDGHFLMLSGLISKVENETAFSPGRNLLSGLKAFKKLGDLSAHNRRFNARNTDIEQIRTDLRVISEELLHLGVLKK